MALGRVRAACQVGYNASVYDRPELLWTQAAFVAPQMHPFDRTFYEPTIGFTPRRWLTDVRARYGGVDAILLWPTYPNIGIDARNQFDMVRSMPGGVGALRAVISELHEEGYKAEHFFFKHVKGLKCYEGVMCFLVDEEWVCGV